MQNRVAKFVLQITQTTTCSRIAYSKTNGILKSEWTCMLSYEVIMNLFLSCHLKFKRFSSNQRRIISLRRAHKHFGIPLWNFEKLQLFSFQLNCSREKIEILL